MTPQMRMSMIACNVTLIEQSFTTITLVSQNVMTIHMEMIVRVIFVIGNAIDVMDLKKTNVLNVKNGKKLKHFPMEVFHQI